MNNIFLSHPQVGILEINNIYEEYDGPKIFSASNQSDSNFFAYWIGDTEDAENWFVIPCSPARLISFEKKEINLLSILTQQEQSHFLKVVKPFSRKEPVSIDYIKSKEVNGIVLPDDDIFAEQVVPASLKDNKKLLYPTHELKISKTNSQSKKNVLLNQVTLVSEKFTDLFLSFNAANDIDGEIQALTARYGSFAISLQASEMGAFERILKHISELMLNLKPISETLIKNDIDVKAFCLMLEAIVTSSVDLEFTSKSEPNNPIFIKKDTASRYLKSLSRESLKYISTSKVPQADDLGKIFKVIEMTWHGDDVTPESLGVQQRHVEYYRQAAKILGFMTSNGIVTALGQRVIMSDDEIKMIITAKAFESSDCGWAWINWREVEDIRALSPADGRPFLKECCPALSDETAERRGDTLSRWLRKLQPYYRPYI